MTFLGTDNCIPATASSANAAVSPNIAIKRDEPADAKAFDGVANKPDQYFSPAPGQRD
jgi:ferredoxin